MYKRQVFAWTLAPVQAFAAGTYDPTDVAAVNKIIEANGLQADGAAPESWGFARWSDDTPKRLLELNLDSRSLTGTLDFGADGLEELTILRLDNNPFSYTHLDVYKRQTLSILPHRGRMAWNRLSRPLLAEPPAESPSTM